MALGSFRMDAPRIPAPDDPRDPVSPRIQTRSPVSKQNPLRALLPCRHSFVSGFGSRRVVGHLSFLPEPEYYDSSQYAQLLFRCPPERFTVPMVSPGVFFTHLASQNVAKVILSRGAQKLGSSVFLFHASLSAAEAAVCSPSVMMQKSATPSCEANKKQEEDDATVRLSRSMPPLLGKPPLPSCTPFVGNASGAAPPPPKHSYRDTLLRGPSSPPPKTPPLPSITSTPKIHPNACFRCFATDHHIRACR
jgi:hypothetical protein